MPILNKGLSLVNQMRAMLTEFGLGEDLPSLTEFLDELKIFVQDVKTHTSDELSILSNEFTDTKKNLDLLKMLINMMEKPDE